MLYSINWPNFIACLTLLLHVSHNMHIVIICCPVCDIINFEINFSFLKVACRVQVWKKKTFCENNEKFGYSFIKMTLYLCIYFVFTKNPIILSPFKINTSNFTMYILTILTCPLKIYVIRLCNLIKKDHSFSL